MSTIDKFLNYMKINDEDDDEYLDDDYLDDEDEVPVKKGPRKVEPVANDEVPEKPVKRPFAVKSAPIHTGKKNGNGMEVCGIKPTSFEETREITDTLLSNRTVILNLEGMDKSIAQRILDFTSGSIYALGGNLQKISNYVFVITPASVGVSGDFTEFADNLGAGMPMR
ncbi:MAG: cell division protein SepF [Lachnospiraceae bacterium]|nr:cell division protein SepF [Lachnospiraceae bacterium]